MNSVSWCLASKIEYNLIIPQARQANFACTFKVGDEVGIEQGRESYACNDLVVERWRVSTSSKQEARRRPVVREIAECDGKRMSYRFTVISHQTLNEHRQRSN